MACHKKQARKKARKKVIRKNGKRYYRTKSGLTKLRGNQKPPRKR